MNIRIALCAGETSGDQLGAGLIKALRERFPDAQFAGIGGDNMRAAGMDTWFDASELAVMGLAEVLAHLPRLLRLRKAFRQRVLDWKPDVFIGIDAPDSILVTSLPTTISKSNTPRLQDRSAVTLAGISRVMVLATSSRMIRGSPGMAKLESSSSTVPPTRSRICMRA